MGRIPMCEHPITSLRGGVTIQTISVISSNLRAVGYNPLTKVLRIVFYSGTYDYFGVPISIYEGLMNAGSKGQYHHRYIKDIYVYHRIK